MASPTRRADSSFAQIEAETIAPLRMNWLVKFPFQA
jgi:hypothetical protein